MDIIEKLHNTTSMTGVWVRRAPSRPDPTKRKIMTMNRKDAGRRVSCCRL